jgi:hypothetical protein
MTVLLPLIKKRYACRATEEEVGSMLYAMKAT